jgi:hypothetical protein
MINMYELRLGNWLLQDGTNYINVGIIQKNFYATAINERNITRFEPVPLTPEILEKCGFERLDRFFEKDEIILLLVGGDTILYYYSTKSDKRTEIQYLHQLQNLYFALVGEELNIEL